MIVPDPVYIKHKNLELILNGKMEGSKFFAYIKLLEKKGSEIETKSNLKGAKMLYLGDNRFIGAKITKYKNGSYKLQNIRGQLDN